MKRKLPTAALAILAAGSATAFGAFGALALVLVVLGIFSVLSYDVAQRRHEFGVRMALGAERGRVARMIVGEGLRLALLGAAIGLVASLAAGGLVAPLLFETSPREPLILAGVAVVLAAGALLGTVAPSVRALRVEPVVALRGE